MKRVKTLRIILVVILILLLAAVILINIFANSATKAAIESAGTKALGVGVNVGDVDLSIIAGKLGLKKLVIENPPGYQHKRLLELNKAQVQVIPRSLLTNEVRIKDVKLDGIDLVLEQKGLSNNLQDVIKTMSKSPKAEPSGKKLHIDNLEISDVTVNVKLLPVPGKADTVTLKLSPIRMKNLGSDNKLDLAALSGKILMAIAGGIAQQGAGVIPKDMLNALSAVLGKTLNMGMEIIGGEKGIIKGTENVGKGVTEGLKGLLKPKEEK
jgi:hypothetical protein